MSQLPKQKTACGNSLSEKWVVSNVPQPMGAFGMASKKDSRVQLFGFLFALGALGFLGLIGRALMTEEDKKQLDLGDKYGGDTVPIDDLPRRHSLSPGSYQATLMRQSGNVYRELGVFPSPEAALLEGVKSLRRAQVSDVRITHSDSDSLAAYRQIYNFKGRAEGKKLAGIVVRRQGITGG